MATTSRQNDWGLAPSPAGASSAFVIPVIVTAAFFLLIGIFFNWVVALLVAVVDLVVWSWLIVTTGRRILNSVGARPPKGDEAARILNIVEGLAQGETVTLSVIDDGSPNALVTWAGDAQIAVTTGLAEGFSRTESEAVVAHCLARIRSGEARTTTFQMATGLPKPPPVGAPHDVAAVAITRYPPGLAAALEKCDGGSGRWAYAWLAGEPPSHMPTSDRIAALNDL